METNKKSNKLQHCDHHIHFYEDGKIVSLERIKEILELYISNNITSVIDMGHKNGIGLKLKKIFKDRINIKTCGYALYKDGGYGSFIGFPIKDRKEIPAVVHMLCQKGVDFIKVINSGIVTTKPDEPVSDGGFSLEELKIIVEEAKIHGLNVACHVNGDKRIQESIIAGVSSIEHGFFISLETIKMMKEFGVEWTPTANALFSITKFLADHEKRYIEYVVREHLEKIKVANQLGIKINIGSDGGSKGIEHIKDFFKECKLLLEV